MKLENQVVNLELSKKLKTLGVEQESLFYWIDYSNKYDKSNKSLWEIVWHERNQSGISAFTVAELGEGLPNCYASYRRGTNATNTEWICMDNRDIVHFFADTEANVRAKMRIYLIEKKLINNH